MNISTVAASAAHKHLSAFDEEDFSKLAPLECELEDNGLALPEDSPEPKLWMYDRVVKDGVIHLVRPPTSQINAATVIGDLDAPECATLLKSPTTVGANASAPYVAASSWTRVQGAWGEVISDFLTTHPERKSKDNARALFYAESDKTGRKHNGHDFQFKLKDKIRRIYAVAIDFDGGNKTVEQIAARIRAAGLFAVLYTTFSHTTKGGPGSDRFRVILPLAEPFELGNGSDRQERHNEYEARYVGLCQMLAPDRGWDFTASRPSQLMYAPARPKGALFKHYILAGRGLKLTDFPLADVSPYRKREAPKGVSRGGDAHNGEPAILSDGFDLRGWADDHGEDFLLSNFLEMIGWDVGGKAGDGFDILCPNEAGHSEGSDLAWGIDGPDAEKGATIFCHHDHCAGLHTIDFIKLVEERAGLGDDWATMSAALCDPMFYPDGSDVRREYYLPEVVNIEWLKTPTAVRKAFSKVTPNAGEEAFAALYAGVVKGGSGGDAIAKLDELMKALGRFSANDLKRLAKRGKELHAADCKAFAAAKVDEERAEYAAALTRDDLAHPSMDPAEPLGGTMQSALATLGRRYAVVDMSGKFRVVRKPNLEAFATDTDSTIVVYGKQDFLDLHLDRQVKVADDLVNPATIFLNTEKRKSGIVFAPFPIKPGANDFNTYQGRKLKAKEGGWETLKDFLFRIVCNGDAEKFDFLILWMAHMVQRPGEKPGTAIVIRGEGGTGKDTFGAILSKLAAPHVKQLEKGEHVVGRFAGEHLSQCILAVVTEAVFGGDHKVANELKALITEPTIQVEAKGLNVITAPSYVRLCMVSNGDLVVMIEGNGSERRFFVVEISNAEKQKIDFFAKVHEAINGDEMAGLLDYLERYDPASAGGWDAVRTAPETAERKLMGWHSMRASARKLLEVLKDGEVTLNIEGMLMRFTADADGLRVPVTAFRDYIHAAGDRRRAEDGDVETMFARYWPGVELIKGRSDISTDGQALKGTRWWLFPSAALAQD